MFVDYDSFAYKNYNDFLDDLKPENKLYKLLKHHVFRGQSEDWPLLPSIFRDNNKDTVAKYCFYEEFKGYEHQFRYVEYYFITEFYKNANLLGLPLSGASLPDFDYIFAENPINYHKLMTIDWLPDNLTETAALAQHYGLMTRLLDWSFDINVALYFAAIGAINKVLKQDDISNDNLVIWILSSTDISIATSLKGIDIVKPDVSEKIAPLKFVIPNYHTNPNICAQKGVLTYWKVPAYADNVQSEPLDILLKNSNWPETEKIHGSLYKLTIPATECIKIIEHLSVLNYNRATIFPGYNGAAEKIEEEQKISVVKRILNSLK